MFLLPFLILAFHHGRPGLGAAFSFQQQYDNANANDNDNSAWTVSPKPTELREPGSEIFKLAKLPVTVESIVDLQGNRLDNGGRNSWNASMGKDILIVDIATRILPQENGPFNIKDMDRDAVEGSGMLTVPQFNHYAYCKRRSPLSDPTDRPHSLSRVSSSLLTYPLPLPLLAAQVHGYAYAFLYPKKGEDRYNTWTKPRVLQEMLRSHKFVVFVGTDATINRPEVPMEFWLNRWNVTPSTPIAMPADRQQAFDDWENDGQPSINRKVELHTGAVIFQNIPATHEVMDAWKECTMGIRGGQWKDRWTRDQHAFAEYLRSVFNPQLENILVCVRLRIHPQIPRPPFSALLAQEKD